jgi:hypothetical protein
MGQRLQLLHAIDHARSHANVDADQYLLHELGIAFDVRKGHGQLRSGQRAFGLLSIYQGDGHVVLELHCGVANDFDRDVARESRQS